MRATRLQSSKVHLVRFFGKLICFVSPFDWPFRQTLKLFEGFVQHGSFLCRPHLGVSCPKLFMCPVQFGAFPRVVRRLVERGSARASTAPSESPLFNCPQFSAGERKYFG